MKIANITAEGLAKIARQGAIDVIDVRTPAEFQEVHIPHARNVPLDQLDSVAVARQRQGSPGEPLFVICHLGVRSLMACELLASSGVASVVNVDGGTQAWADAGLPLIRPPS